MVQFLIRCLLSCTVQNLFPFGAKQVYLLASRKSQTFASAKQREMNLQFRVVLRFQWDVPRPRYLRPCLVMNIVFVMYSLLINSLVSSLARLAHSRTAKYKYYIYVSAGTLNIKRCIFQTFQHTNWQTTNFVNCEKRIRHTSILVGFDF